MGGTNQATAPPPPARTKSGQSIRYHKNAGEAHFHDDAGGFKGIMPYGDFQDVYTKWRDSDDGSDLVMIGTDDRGGHVQITCSPFVENGKQEVSVSVETIDTSSLPVGDSLVDLDKMAGY